MALISSLCVSPNFGISPENKLRLRVKARASSGNDIVVESHDSVSVNSSTSWASSGKEQNEAVLDRNDRGLKSGLGKPRERKLVKDEVFNEVELLWDDGYGSKTVEDYFEAAKEIIKYDGGPPRWFSPVECGPPVRNAPDMFFLPGLDGTGMGLILHHKALGKAFHLWCFHIPLHDRTPFQGLVRIVEETIRLEHASNPSKPIYLVGDSFGGCLALSVAARNPHIDLVVILANPATCFNRSQLQPLFPLMEAIPGELYATIPFALSSIMGNPLKMASVDIDSKLPPQLKAGKLRAKLTSLLLLLPGLRDIIPRESLLWKLKLLKSAASYANSRLHAVTAEVLVLASGDDNLLPSMDEAKRLERLLKNCEVRCFKENGHTIFLEDSLSLLTVIKGTCKYRRARRLDYVSDFLPPSGKESEYALDKVFRTIRYVSGSVLFSTRQDGTIVKGLLGVPDEGPVLYVGYHMLMGLELAPLCEAFLKEKNILLRGVAHPVLFNGSLDTSSSEFGFNDWLRVFGALPVAASNFFKLLSTKSHVLLYPGGAREALHYRGEQYKLFWPIHQEFVRMAARFGAKIVPFGSVGEDDVTELVLDYHDLMKIPVLNDHIRRTNREAVRIRDESSGEVANADLFIPGLLPKVPGRFYYLFGKPIETNGRPELLDDKEQANQMYLQAKSEVEKNIAYLLKKREEDPYRNILDRLAYRVLYPESDEIPTFKP